MAQFLNLAQEFFLALAFVLRRAKPPASILVPDSSFMKLVDRSGNLS